jgi:hypothetical protein
VDQSDSGNPAAAAVKQGVMGLARTALEGHDQTLGWGDFQGLVPPNRAAGEDAYTEARFDLIYDYDWDDSHGAAHGYRINHVQVTVAIEPANMWALKSAQTAALLQHEQGHYDIVALLGRDLFEELTGWNSSNPPKRFRKETDLKDAANRVLRRYKLLSTHIAGSSRSDGVYDKQTNHFQDSKAQDKWNKALAAARANGTPLMKELSALGVAPP